MASLTVMRVLARRAETWLLLAIIVWIAIGFLALRGVPHIQDEYLHEALIRRLIQGDWTADSAVTVFPTQHFLIASMLRVFTVTPSVDAMRLVAMFLHLLVLPGAYLVARGAGGERDDALRRTLMLALMPSITPFIFLIYVDVFAIALLLLSVAAQQRNRHGLSALVIAAASVVRQTSIIWCVWQLASWLLARWRREAGRSMGGAWYVIVLIAFGALLLWNGGLVVGDASAHPVGRLFPGNVFFALVLLWIYFLPLHVAILPAVLRRIRQQPMWLAWLLLAGLAFYLLFRADHPYNAIAPAQIMHNRLVGWLLEPHGRLLGGVLVAWSVATLWLTPIRGQGSSLLLPFAMLSLLPLGLVEPRYAAPAIALWLLMRGMTTRQTEWLLVGWLATLGSIVLAYQASYTMTL